MHKHVFALTDAEGAVCGLVFHRGVEPEIEMYHASSLGKVEPKAPRLEAYEENRWPRGIAETLNRSIALRPRHFPMQHERFDAPILGDDLPQNIQHFHILTENEHLFARFGDAFEQREQ